jgi:hypothetical protein
MERRKRVESGNWVESQRHPGVGPPMKARPYFLRLTSRHQTEGDLLRTPKAGVLDRWISLWSLHREPILENRCEYFVWGMRPGHALGANGGPGSLSPNVPGFLIRLGFLLP